ncbi:response regulator [Olivibacter sp. XZL3]|uniref:response regulator n=1 Tax=Olivibacter sp. XZL3 TaxID=1735116 RepID=UPI0010646D62|nr:response regulator [Olivibacter sp. XZL3]
MNHILIQDSDPDVLFVLQEALVMEDYRTVACTDYEEVWSALVQQRPQAILLEYKLGGKACNLLVSRIRALYPDIPIIALSCEKELIERCEQFPFDACLAKPFDLTDLYRLVGVFVANR